MTATIKMDAYDYTIFGDVNGQLTYVSPDTLLDQTGDEKACRSIAAKSKVCPDASQNAPILNSILFRA